ncbi:hypothetical protein DPMN_023709 [Dreissena polymorpha]|uniref:Uncharacterized protein n=1 Tax=Dreissena polymorpha TaxID=45954 RepID=A0A9D4QV71_DREPO|nr:hypothetical protein DPMN_074043 [Dreissena polymorpha]KAH3817737.1 hypothetical protein DPMN_119292 [Dreissena polymorpha]KAH3843420.1 hypothetical protein DPMN_116937 [Dreissena polymorpha]KAH3860785.1 hypothetical protein DPMN_023709 [Dreissena polymorpha]
MIGRQARSKNVTSRVKNCHATWQPCFSTNYHEDWTINLTSTVKTAPPPGGHFHDDWTKNVTSTVLNKENCHAPWHPGFSTIRSIFELVQDINGTHVLTKFHEDWTINMTS